MSIERVDLGVCPAYEYEGDGPTAVVLPGAMLVGMPAVYFAFASLFAQGWRVILVWDELLDRSQDPWAWSRARAEAAAAYAGDDVSLLIAKSLTTRAAPVAAERGWPAVWLTPLFGDGIADAVRARTAPALLIGGTNDPMWDGAAARELGEVLELDGADHGLARLDHAPQIAEAVAEFSGRRARGA